MTAGIEIIRRTIWGIITVEYGVLKNKDKLSYRTLHAGSLLVVNDEDPFQSEISLFS